MMFGEIGTDAVEMIKALNPKVAWLFDKAELLVNARAVSADDVARYSNILPTSVVVQCFTKVFSTDFVALLLSSTNISTDRAVTILTSMPPSLVATILNSPNMSDSKAAQILNRPEVPINNIVTILNDTNISASKAAQILNNSNISTSRIITIFNDPNATIDKIASIIDSYNISANRVASILGDPNISVSRVALILNSQYISPSKVALVLYDANITTSKAQQILTNTNMTASKAQSILYSMVEQGFYNKLIDVITLNAPNASYTSNTTLSTGVNRYRNLSIASGVTLTLGAEPGVIVAYSVTNNGTIASGWVKGAGGSPGHSGGGTGGVGRGAVVILANSIAIGTVTSNGSNGTNGGSAVCVSSGYSGGSGNFMLISGDFIPYGGDGGCPYIGTGKPNGGGGGGTNYVWGSTPIRGGNGGDATAVIYQNSQSLLTYLFKPICDWWLVNVVNKTPSVTISIPSLGGSGGGGGGTVCSECSGGGGGGGGGQIIIYGANVTAGTVQAKGGNGGAGYNNTCTGCYGGGGGGGVIYILYRNLTGTFTYTVSGGTGARAGGTGIFRAISV
jgi:hypothetical protein